ncbi:MAG: aminoglycoside phosphotransferase, partial [Betaproteobacteria bacterium]|nr:aminoglycoside phosphotransferase [Betaproteobacteria bacterium]
MDPRQDSLKQWLLTIAADYALKPESLEVASADASFRRYFRVQCDDQRQ